MIEEQLEAGLTAASEQAHLMEEELEAGLGLTAASEQADFMEAAGHTASESADNTSGAWFNASEEKVDEADGDSPNLPSVAHIWGDGQSGGLSLEQRGGSPLRPLRMPILQVEELGSKSASYSADEPTPPRAKPQPTLRHVNSMRAALLSGRITGAEDGAEDRVVTRKAEGGAEVTL